MFTRAKSDHERFEEMCALAPIGELSSRELHEFRSHLTVCAQCRLAHEDYGNVIKGALPQPGARDEIGSSLDVIEPDNGERARFFAEARRRGFTFSPQAQRGYQVVKGRGSAARLPVAGSESWYRAALAAIVLVIASAGVVGGYQLGKARYRRTPEAAEQARLKDETGQTAERTSPGDAPVTARPSTPTATSQFDVAAAELPESVKEIARLQAELKSAEDEKLALQAGSKSLEDQLQAAASQIQALQAAASQVQALQSEIDAGKASAQSLTAKLEEYQRNLAQLSAELRNMTDGHHQDANAMTAQDARVKDLEEKLRDTTAELQRTKSLLKPDHDIRDLMTARNLHVVDVMDVDGKGTTRRTFARAFYTEGKYLMLYVYDPVGPRGNSEFALQGWGTRGSSNIARNLGIFYVDKPKSNLWILEFNNPRVLAEIDSVFVTIEPPGGSKKPTSEGFLYAYLKGAANHP
jgi:hypothetical protein